MRLKTLLIRFYKSFNFDYLRKNNSEVRPKPWELIDEKWYPYVSIPIDSKVTNVVGANESGKSHPLSAIEKGISGQEIERQDFCRYSQYFTLQKGKIRFPDFGFEWCDLSEEDIQNVKTACRILIQLCFEQ